MRLLHVVSNMPTNRIMTEDFKYLRWFDCPLREAYLYPIPVERIPIGTVMPKDWMR